MIGPIRPGRELSADPRFGRRIARLATTSAGALGLIWGAADRLEAAPAWTDPALLAGWILMPLGLLVSLRAPAARLGLALPSVLVGGALLAICLTALPAGPPGVGWLLLMAGVWFGGALGLWFWLRLAPVPPPLDDPFAPGRWLLIAGHVALIVVGLALIWLASPAR